MKRSFRRAASLFCALALLVSSVRALTTDEALALLEENYLETLPQAAYAAQTLDELFAAVADPYTYYMTEEEYQAFLGSVEGEGAVVGIGVSVQLTEDGIEIISLLPGGSAEEAGIRRGDRIVAIEGVPCVPAAETDVSRITGTEGTFVSVTVLRADGKKHNYRLERRSLTILNTSAASEGGVTRITCTSFGSQTGVYFQNAVSQHQADTRLWIVDLRGNAGGLADSGAEAAAPFVNMMPFIRYRDKAGKSLYSLCYGSRQTDAPIIVLTDGGSASASEMFAGCVRSCRAGISLGGRTFGKGVAQNVLDEDNCDLFHGDALKITTLRIYSADGNTTDRIGVIPTLCVPDALTDAAAELLSAPQPETDTAEGFLRFRLGGWYYYLDLSVAAQEAYQEAFRALLNALPPDASVSILVNGKWLDLGGSGARVLYGVPARFSDTAGSEWEADILTLAAYGLLNGTADGTFLPDQMLSRAELCTMLANLLNLTSGGRTAFPDVPENCWYAGAVGVCEAFGLMNGAGDGLFHPHDPVTQEQLAAVLGRLSTFLNCDTADYGDAFDEGLIPLPESCAGFASWAQRGITMLSTMLVGPDGNDVNLFFAAPEQFAPKSSVTRGECAAAICRLLKGVGILVY